MAETSVTRKVAAILAADAVGYTRLMADKDGTGRVQRVHGRWLVIGHQPCIADGIGSKDGCYPLRDSGLGHSAIPLGIGSKDGCYVKRVDGLSRDVSTHPPLGSPAAGSRRISANA